MKLDDNLLDEGTGAAPTLDKIIYGRDSDNPQTVRPPSWHPGELDLVEIGELATKLWRPQPPPFLMHYCSIGIAHRILTEKSIAATHVSKLQEGDQFEARQGWGLVQVAAELLVSQHPGDLVAQALEERIRYAKCPWEGPYWIHVACLSSEIGDEDLAWRFSKGGPPAGLRFKTTELEIGMEAALKREGMQARLEAVHYSGTEFIRVATALMERALRRSLEWIETMQVPSRGYPSAAHRAFLSLQPELATLAMTHKGASFREEAEWRLVVTAMPKQQPVRFPRPGQNGAPPRLALSWPRGKGGPPFPATLHTF